MILVSSDKFIVLQDPTLLYGIPRFVTVATNKTKRITAEEYIVSFGDDIACVVYKQTSREWGKKFLDKQNEPLVRIILGAREFGIYYGLPPYFHHRLSNRCRRRYRDHTKPLSEYYGPNILSGFCVSAIA